MAKQRVRSAAHRLRGRTLLAAALGALTGALAVVLLAGDSGGTDEVRTVTVEEERIDRFAYREMARLSRRTCRRLSRPVLAHAFGSKVPAARDADGNYLALAYAERVRINPIRLQQAAYDGCIEGIAERHAPDLDKVSLNPARSSVATSRTRVRATVSPGSGGASTVFRVSFRSGGELGAANGRRRVYVLQVDGPQKSGCAHDRDAYVDRGAAGEHVAAELDPAAGKGVIWCHGRYRGRVLYHDGFRCPDIGQCVEPGTFQRLVREVGRFEFTVRG